VLRTSILKESLTTPKGAIMASRYRRRYNRRRKHRTSGARYRKGSKSFSRRTIRRKRQKKRHFKKKTTPLSAYLNSTNSSRRLKQDISFLRCRSSMLRQRLADLGKPITNLREFMHSKGLPFDVKDHYIRNGEYRDQKASFA